MSYYYVLGPGLTDTVEWEEAVHGAATALKPIRAVSTTAHATYGAALYCSTTLSYVSWPDASGRLS